MKIGKNLRELREIQNLSQQALCDKLSLVRGTYACYETDKRMPDLDTMILLADFYNISLDELVGRDFFK